MKLPLLDSLDIAVKSSDLDGLQILHLSDLHINKKTPIKTIEKLVAICNSCSADFIIITGDIIDCKVKYISKKIEVLNTITKKVYYISGNHDIFYGLEELNLVLNNLHFLDNTQSYFSFKNKQISIVGISDRFSKFFNIARDEEKVKDYLKADSNSILLAHQPKDYKLALFSDAKLFLCGHTHGGQIFPFHYLVKLFQPFLNGLFYKSNTAIYVNKGLGNWGIDYRYKANNEITLLKLTSKSVK